MEPTDREVRVATATAVVYAPDDPYRVLVGDSHKHPSPVLPGGKIDLTDVPSGCKNFEEAARICIVRELMEEARLHIKSQTLNLLGIADDPQRDVRRVPARKLKDAVTDPPFVSFAIDSEDFDHTYVPAHYGCPDYLFAVSHDGDDPADSDELFNLRFVDMRSLAWHSLSAGHDVVVGWYLRLVKTGLNPPPEAFQDFDRDRALLLAAD